MEIGFDIIGGYIIAYKSIRIEQKLCIYTPILQFRSYPLTPNIADNISGTIAFGIVDRITGDCKFIDTI